MNSSRTRLSVIAAFLVAGFCLVMLNLWILMVSQHEDWARRSHENRWSFRSVPSQRGRLHDRHGRLLAHDEPTMQLALYYQRFRLRHPVGAAVHGATLWAGLQPGSEGTRFSYLEGALGPMAAAEHLLAMPTRLLRRGVLEKEVAAELGPAVTTVLAATSGFSRKKVYAAVRRMADERGDTAIGDVLDRPRSELLAEFAANLASLRRFDADLRQARHDRLLRAGLPDDEAPGLLEVLDELRRASLEKKRAKGRNEPGSRQGSLIETVSRVIDDHVPFDLAASLRIGAERHPGLEITPSIERVQTVAPGTALRSLLGSVSDLDRSRPDDAWLDRYFAREMPEEWLEDLVPAGFVGTDEERLALQTEARERYERAMLREERRGATGVEAAFNDALMGQLGVRFVEHDSKRREQVLWSHLRVESGEDLTLTIDLDVQKVAELTVSAAQTRIAAMYAADTDRVQVEAALAVIDVRSGDVLAYAGAPIVTPLPVHVPGVVWPGIGYIGSVVKPFVLVEQLQSIAASRPHTPFAAIEPCSGSLRYGGTTIKCGHAHWEAGRDPIEAIAESCNLFFYQCAIGLGEEGLARALRRFGLMAPAHEGDPFAAAWQPTVRGIPIARPRVDTDTLLPRRGIGYGVEASPLSVARAYAGIATGHLPTLGVRHGEVRPRVSLGDLEPELDVVREGLRKCVETGTADRIEMLQRMHVLGKTGTAEVGEEKQNNAWFAGYLPGLGRDGLQLGFCAVVYWVPDNVHGGDAAGQMVADFLHGLQAAPELDARYLQPEGGR